MPWGLYHKTFYVVINSVLQKQVVFVNINKKFLTITKTLA
jgi:hypothetical protein